MFSPSIFSRSQILKLFIRGIHFIGVLQFTIEFEECGWLIVTWNWNICEICNIKERAKWTAVIRGKFYAIELARAVILYWYFSKVKTPLHVSILKFYPCVSVTIANIFQILHRMLVEVTFILIKIDRRLNEYDSVDIAQCIGGVR